MKIDVSQVFRSQPSKPSLVVHPAVEKAHASASTASRVTLSSEARQAAAADAAQTADDIRPFASLSLKDLLKKYDFSSVTPAQFAQVAGELFARGEISQTVAGNFVGTDLDKVEAIPRDQPIDMLEHMKFMAEAAKAAAPIARKQRNEALETLQNMVAVAKGARFSVGRDA